MSDGMEGMMDPPADDAAMDNAMEEEKPLMDEEKPASEKKETEPKEEEKEEEPPAPINEHDHEMCCCCICQCSTKETRDMSCCGCFPIKCGIVCIGIIYCLVLLGLFIDTFFYILNEYIHWWYVLVTVFLLCPMLVGVTFMISFFSKDNGTTRTLLYTACILAIVTFTFVTIWNLCYFQWLYKYDVVYSGMDVVGYTMQTKKAFMVWQLFIALCLDFLFAYFLCVCANYSIRLDGEPPKKEGGALDSVQLW